MRAQSTSFATLFLLLALGVMAVVGVFGVPRFSSVVASPESEVDDDLGVTLGSFRDAGAGISRAQGVNDLFAPLDEHNHNHDHHKHAESAARDFQPGAVDVEHKSSQSVADPRIVDLLGGPSEAESTDSFDEWTINDRTEPPVVNERERSQPFAAVGREVSARRDTSMPAAFDSHFSDQEMAAADRRPEMGNPFGEELADRPTRNTAPADRAAREAEPADGRPFHRLTADSADRTEPPAAEQPLTWRDAVSRLNALGIQQYRLSPGTKPDAFYFCCFLSPNDNPRITHRFEAEANEPLAAVEEVLAQVTQWQSGR